MNIIGVTGNYGGSSTIAVYGSESIYAGSHSKTISFTWNTYPIPKQPVGFYVFPANSGQTGEMSSGNSYMAVGFISRELYNGSPYYDSSFVGLKYVSSSVGYRFYRGSIAESNISYTSNKLTLTIGSSSSTYWMDANFYCYAYIID